MAPCPVNVTWPAALLEWLSVVNPAGGALPPPVPVLPTSMRTCEPGTFPKVTATCDMLTRLPMFSIRPVPLYRLPKCGDCWYESVVQPVPVEPSIASPAWPGLSPPPGPYAAAPATGSTAAGVLLGEALWVSLALGGGVEPFWLLNSHAPMPITATTTTAAATASIRPLPPPRPATVSRPRAARRGGPPLRCR